jgi:quercetin dioxygenase-like cupin family protein
LENRPRVLRPEDLVRPEQQTSGMLREEAFATENLWIGVVRAEPRQLTGWHHHGEWDTYAYVLSGALRLESGPGGAHVQEAVKGHFLFIPKHAVHREGSGGPGFEAVAIRVGTGPILFNVEGPEDPAQHDRPAR